jgi:hypothetical protein
MAKITFAGDHKTSGGRTYKAGSTHEVNGDDARSLIFRGKARLATEETSASAEGPKLGPTAETNTPAGK